MSVEKKVKNCLDETLVLLSEDWLHVSYDCSEKAGNGLKVATERFYWKRSL